MREGFQLRQHVCGALLARRQEMEPFIVGRFDVYVNNMMREGSWGGAQAPLSCRGSRRAVLISGSVLLHVCVHCTAGSWGCSNATQLQHQGIRQV